MLYFKKSKRRYEFLQTISSHFYYFSIKWSMKIKSNKKILNSTILASKKSTARTNKIKFIKE